MALTERTALTGSVALPFYQLAGPDLGGVNPTVSLGLRVALDG